jgi:hypothetical protein
LNISSYLKFLFQNEFRTFKSAPAIAAKPLAVILNDFISKKKIMFCKSCGRTIDDDSQFCSYCGSKQSDRNKPNSPNIETIESKTVNVNLSFSRQNNNIPNQKSIKKLNEQKYDLNYSKETEATIIGTIILLATGLLVIFKPNKFDDSNSANQLLAISSFAALILRILLIIWVINIAKRQNRNTTAWGILAFFFPSIALIIVGLQNKLFKNIDIDNSLSNSENSLMLTEKALYFMKDKKFNECIRFAEKAIELDQNNIKASELILKAKLQIPVHEVSNKQVQTVYRETIDNKLLKIISKNYETIGALVFINDEIASDGEYQYLNDNRRLIVKDGKIEQMIN